MNEKADKELWDDFRGGDDYALSYIYHENIDFLYFYGKKFTPHEELIFDVIHDLFLYLIQKRKSLGDTVNIRMYLLKSFRRRLFEEIKKKDPIRDLNKDQLSEPCIVFSVEENLILNEQQSERELKLLKGMNELSVKQREILYYKYTCDLDYKQICEIMSITYESARQMVSRAVHSLNKFLLLDD